MIDYIISIFSNMSVTDWFSYITAIILAIIFSNPLIDRVMNQIEFKIEKPPLIIRIAVEIICYGICMLAVYIFLLLIFLSLDIAKDLIMNGANLLSESLELIYEQQQDFHK